MGTAYPYLLPADALGTLLTKKPCADRLYLAAHGSLFIYITNSLYQYLPYSSPSEIICSFTLVSVTGDT